MSKEITITVKEGSIEHAIHEYRTKRLLTYSQCKPGYTSPFDIIRFDSNQEEYFLSTFSIEKPKPITKNISAEDVRMAVAKCGYTGTFNRDAVEALIENLGLCVPKNSEEVNHERKD